VTCWVIGNGDRTERVSRVLLAWRGNPGCLARDGAVLPSVPASRHAAGDGPVAPDRLEGYSILVIME